MINRPLSWLSRIKAAAAKKDETSPVLKKIANEISQLLENQSRFETTLALMKSDLEFLRHRTSNYVGDGIALANLASGPSIFVNSNDIGPSLNVLAGGRYETANVNLLLSYVRPDTIFLDIGANIGIFSIEVGRRLRGGRAFAFEPQERLVMLLRRSAFLNGLVTNIDQPGILTSHALGASNESGEAVFLVPDDHLGGGRIETGLPQDSIEAGRFNTCSVASIRTVRLDDHFDPQFRCDLVKLDVEGHELSALEGMIGIIRRSPRIKILFEHFGVAPDVEARIFELLGSAGLSIWSVGDDAVLRPIEGGVAADRFGYLFAARADDPALQQLDRRRFSIFPEQLSPGGNAVVTPTSLTGTFSHNELIFYGPYWYLEKGDYVLKLDGSLDGDISIDLSTRIGLNLSRCTLRGAEMSVEFHVQEDAINFECVGRAVGSVTLDLRSIEIARR